MSEQQPNALRALAEKRQQSIDAINSRYSPDTTELAIRDCLRECARELLALSEHTEGEEFLTPAGGGGEADQECAVCHRTRREHQSGYSASRCTFTTSPTPSAPADFRERLLDTLNLVHAEGRAGKESATAAMADRLAAMAPSAPVVGDAMVERLCATVVGNLTAVQSKKWWEYFHGIYDADDLRDLVRRLTAALAGQEGAE